MTQFINHATEYNELLAEFMELPKPPQNGIGWYDASDLTYDTLWDSQIPVFRKAILVMKERIAVNLSNIVAKSMYHDCRENYSNAVYQDRVDMGYEIVVYLVKYILDDRIL